MPMDATQFTGHSNRRMQNRLCHNSIRETSVDVPQKQKEGRRQSIHVVSTGRGSTEKSQCVGVIQASQATRACFGSMIRANNMLIRRGSICLAGNASEPSLRHLNGLFNQGRSRRESRSPLAQMGKPVVCQGMSHMHPPVVSQKNETWLSNRRLPRRHSEPRDFATFAN